MKEATGELSGAVIAALCVAIFIAFFYYTIYPIIDSNFRAQTACEKAVCSTNAEDAKDGMVDCVYEGKSFKCKFKG